MNFVKLKLVILGNVEEYVIINIDKIVKIREKTGHFEICFNNKENNVIIEDCKENRAELGLQIGNDLIKDGLCKRKK